MVTIKVANPKQRCFFPEYKTGRHWLLAPQTFLVDSFEPFVEEIYLPEVATKPGSLKFDYIKKGLLAPHTPTSRIEKLKQQLHFIKKPQNHYTHTDESIYIDLRAHFPENLAHAITIHLPIALCAKAYLNEIGKSDITLVFPSSLPGHIQEMFVGMGFKYTLTNSFIEGQVCRFSLDSLICIRGALPAIIKSTIIDDNFIHRFHQLQQNLPKKIFIARKDSRRLSNELEVESYLKEHGFEKIFMEDFSIAEQIAMVALADEIVAIHGAALGPIIFRTLFDRPPLRLIELFSPAHMSNVYRIITEQINGNWIGVRGKIWPELIKHAYECAEDKVRQYSLEDFELCLVSLEKALFLTDAKR